MVLPSNIETVTVQATYTGTDGAPLSGSISFTPQFVRLADLSVKTAITNARITAELSGGYFSIDVPVSDDSDLTSQVAYVYRVDENFLGGVSYYILVPHTLAGTTINLATWAPVPPNGITSPAVLTVSGLMDLLERADVLGGSASVASLDAGGRLTTSEVPARLQAGALDARYLNYGDMIVALGPDGLPHIVPADNVTVTTSVGVGVDTDGTPYLLIGVPEA